MIFFSECVRYTQVILLAPPLFIIVLARKISRCAPLPEAQSVGLNVYIFIFTVCIEVAFLVLGHSRVSFCPVLARVWAVRPDAGMF